MCTKERIEEVRAEHARLVATAREIAERVRKNGRIGLAYERERILGEIRGMEETFERLHPELPPLKGW